MDTDTILYIFQLSDSFTKISFSLISKTIYEKSRQYIQSINTAINTSDIFSIIQNNMWYRYIDSKLLGLIGSKFLILKYQQYRLINNNDLLFGACQSGNIETVVNSLIEYGADAYDGGLHEACQSGNIEIIKLLIKHGADD